MSSLQEQLDRIRERVEGGMSAQFLNVMHDATAQLQASGIEDQVLAVGASAPEFDLLDQNGKRCCSPDLLASGPLVLTFYRGFW